MGREDKVIMSKGLSDIKRWISADWEEVTTRGAIKSEDRKDMQDFNLELTKRTIEQKLGMWEAYAFGNLHYAKKKAKKKGFGGDGQFTRGSLVSVFDSRRFNGIMRGTHGRVVSVNGDKISVTFDHKREFLFNAHELEPMNKPWLRYLPSYDRLRSDAVFYPAIILGYGPSFHENLDLIAKLPLDRCRIFATDRTIPILHRYGIKPHFVTNLDSGDQISPFYNGTPRVYLSHLLQAKFIRAKGSGNTRKFFRGKKMPKDWAATMAKWGRKDPVVKNAGSKKVCQLIEAQPGISFNDIADEMNIGNRDRINTIDYTALFAITTNPDCRKWFNGKIHWFNPSVYPWKNTFSKDIECITGMGPIPTAGNVATTTMNLSFLLGCSPIILLGCDFGYAVDPQIKSDLDRSTSFISKVGDKEYRTDGTLYAYAYSTKQMLSDGPIADEYWKRQVINCSGGILHGPYIRSAEFKDVVANICDWDNWEKFQKERAALSNTKVQLPRFHFGDHVDTSD